MAFKMKNPGMGKLAKAAGSPAKFGIEHKGIDSAARGTKGIGPDGEPMKMKKDFGMEGSAMKFKGIRDKIAARKAKKLNRAQDPSGERSASGRLKGRQDIAETGVVSASRDINKNLKELQVDTEGNVKSMKKEKVRGRDVEKADGTVKKKGRRIVKDFDAEGNKTKRVYDSDGNLLKEKTSKTRKLGKKNIGKAAEKKVERERFKDDVKIEKANKPIREANERTKAENKQITIDNAAKFAAEEPKYNAWRKKQIADGAKNVPTFAEAHKARTKATDAPAPTTMKRKSALKKDDKKRSDGGSVEATVTIPGTKGDKIEPSETPEQKAAYAKYLKNETPEQKERRLKRESGGKDAETRTYKSDYTYEKEKPLTPEQKAKREEGEYNKLKVGKKKKKRFISTRVGGKLYDAKQDVKRTVKDLTFKNPKKNNVGKKKKPKKPSKVKQFVTTACPAISKGKN